MRKVTWGTHLGDTKLPTSMTGNPVSDKRFINSIFVSTEIDA